MFIINPTILAIITIWQEAQGEPFEGKVAVAEVIRRRTDRKYSSDGTIQDTVLRKWQFSAWSDKSCYDLMVKSLKLNDDDPIVKQCIQAWNVSADTNHSKSAVLYCNLAAVAKRPVWARDDKCVAVIGNHSFFVD
jgi:spore germination cell wall hydrolase CwlJ-like protein